MRVTNEEFELLVRKLETSAEKNPWFYRLKVLLLTGLGYGYVLFFLALLLFLLFLAIINLVDGTFTLGNIKLLLISATLSYFVIKALIVKMEMPEGYYLKKNEAPALEKTIKKLSSKLKTPKIHAIVLNDEYNASVVQNPKFGLFGPKRNVLLIGIPLISSLTREQFTSVLAHELAHISHSDTAFGAMIYRVRMTWAQLMHSLEKNEQFGTFIFRKFIKWYYPRYSAYTFVMARQAEYAADAASAKVTSPETVRDMLCTISVGGQFFYQKYFNELFEECSKTNDQPKPYGDFFKKTQELDKFLCEDYLNQRLEMKSNVADTHPCMMDRLKAVGMEPVVTQNTESAIEFFFANPDSILQHFDQLWLENNEEKWNEQISSYNDSKQRLQELENMEELDLHGLFERALLTRDIIGPEPAAVLLEEIIEHYPAERAIPAYLRLGDIYLSKETTALKGEVLIRKAMEIDWECKEEALNQLCEYYYYTGQMEALEEARSQLEAWPDVLKQFDEEVSSINSENHFVPHDKLDEELTGAIEVISSHSEIIEAYLVKQITESIPGRKHYVLGLIVHIPEDVDHEAYVNQLMEKYSSELYTFDDTYFYILNGYEDLVEIMKNVQASLIYRATETRGRFLRKQGGNKGTVLVRLKGKGSRSSLGSFSSFENINL